MELSINQNAIFFQFSHFFIHCFINFTRNSQPSQSIIVLKTFTQKRRIYTSRPSNFDCGDFRIHGDDHLYIRPDFEHAAGFQDHRRRLSALSLHLLALVLPPDPPRHETEVSFSSPALHSEKLRRRRVDRKTPEQYSGKGWIAETVDSFLQCVLRDDNGFQGRGLRSF